MVPMTAAVLHRWIHIRVLPHFGLSFVLGVHRHAIIYIFDHVVG